MEETVNQQTQTPATPRQSSKSPMMIIVIVVVVLVVLGILSRGLGFVTGMIGQKAAEKAIESATGGQVKVNNNGTDVTIKTKEGTFSSGTTLPSDWPADVPSYPGAKVGYSGSSDTRSGDKGYAAVLTTADAGGKVVEFYKNELTAKGWTITGTQQAAGITVLTGEKGDLKVGISLTSENGQTTITIGVNQ